MSNVVPFSNDEFYISYNPSRDEFARACDDLAYILGGVKPQDRDETAIVVRGQATLTGSRFYILYGDHREALLRLAPSLSACLQYFKDNINLIGHSSDTIDKLENLN
jgi:hypothetical protein